MTLLPTQTRNLLLAPATAVLLAAAALACAPSGPVPPTGGGIYGRVVTYNDYGSDTGLHGVSGRKVCAFHGSREVGMAGDPVDCDVTDDEGNYALPLYPGTYRPCILDKEWPGGIDCDRCAVSIADGASVRRDREYGPGGGRWYSDSSAAPSSPCP